MTYPQPPYRQDQIRPISSHQATEDPYNLNRDRYYEPGEPRDEEFDVRADFDGTGPRWSELYGQRPDIQGSSYRPVLNPVNTSSYSVYSKSANPAEELVSVPVLGPEWMKTELHEMSCRGQSGIQSEKRTRAWRAWTRDQKGTLGVRWLTRRLLVFILFFLLVGIGIVLYFTIPRPPGFSFDTDHVLSVDNSTVSFSRTPTNFTFTGSLHLIADTSASYLPVHFTSLQATLYDLSTDKVIASGDYGNQVVSKGSDQKITVPVAFSYSALNATDPTWLDIYNACSYIYPGTTRPDMSFRLVMKSSIVGLVTQPETSTQISGVTCPFERPSNGV